MVRFSVWYGSFIVILCGMVPYGFDMCVMFPYGDVLCGIVTCGAVLCGMVL